MYCDQCDQYRYYIEQMKRARTGLDDSEAGSYQAEIDAAESTIRSQQAMMQESATMLENWAYYEDADSHNSELTELINRLRKHVI